MSAIPPPPAGFVLDQDEEELGVPPPPPGFVLDSEEPVPPRAMRPAPLAPSHVVSPPAGAPPPGVSLPPGVPPPAGGEALPPRPNPLHAALLEARRARGGAPVGDMGADAVQDIGARAHAPDPKIPLPGLSAAAPLGMSVARATPGLVSGAVRALPEIQERLRRGVVDKVADLTKMSPGQREAAHDATRLIQKVGSQIVPGLAPGAMAEQGRQLEEKVVRPLEERLAATETARRMDAKKATQSFGEALKDPERFQDWAGSAIPSLAAMAATAGLAGPGAVLPLAGAMESGGKMREIEAKERETGKRANDLSAAGVAAMTGVVNGFLEKFGFETAVGKLADFLPAEAKRGFLGNVSRVVQGMVGEGGTEGLQTVFPNLLTKAFLDSSQDLTEGVVDSIMGGVLGGGGMSGINAGQRKVRFDEVQQRRADRREWRGEEGPGRGAVAQADIDAINESVRGLQNPETADQALERLKSATQALDARVRTLKSEMGMPTNEPQARPAPVVQPPLPADEALARLKAAGQGLDARAEAIRASVPQPPVAPPAPVMPPDRPISLDRIFGAQALGDVVKETRFRDQTAEARGRNVLQAIAGEERQRIANTPGAALRMILGDEPAFRAAPAPELEEPVTQQAPGTTNALRPRVSMPVLDWIEERAGQIDEDRRTLGPEEWSHDESRYFALTDAGLGLPNRAAYQIAERQNPTALQGVLDVDGLKKFNDTFGHENGDEYLGMVPLFARQHGLHLFRVGGDEFVTMYDGDEAVFRQKLETARTGLEASRVPGTTEQGEEYPLHKGFSYGIGRDFKAADAQAYEDKRRRKAGSPAGTDRQGDAEPVGVGGGAGAEAPAGPGDPAGVPPPVRKRGGGTGGSGAPPAGPASLPPPVAPPAPAAAAPASREPQAQAAPPPKPAPVDAFAGKKAGKEGEVFTAGGERVGYRWRLANLFRDLIPSHTETFEPNPRFPSEYQPRDRERRASRDQIEGMSKDMRPGALGESYYASDGAPIVGSDGVIESGNARSIAAQLGYRAGRMGHYVTWAEENAERFGYTAEDVRAEGDGAFFVRERITPTNDRGELVKQFNVPTVARMSDAETARGDADRLTPELLAKFFPADDGLALRAVRNRPFVAGFFETIPENERGEMLDEDGQLSKGGLSRIQNALLGKAYGRSAVLERLTESVDDNIKQVSTALVNAAPAMATLRGSIESGDTRPELDPTPAIIEAAEKLSWLRETNGTVKNYLRQEGLFGPDMTPAGAEILQAFEEFKRSGAKTTKFLTELARGITLGGSARQESLFDDLETLPLESFVRVAHDYVGTDGDTTGSLFGGEEAPAPDDPGRPGPQGVRPGGSPGSVDRPRVSLAHGAPTQTEERRVLLVERYAQQFAKGWKDRPLMTVVPNESGLPDELRALAGDSRVEGVYVPREDRVYLVAGSLESRADVERVVLHEIMGHAGLRRLIGREAFGGLMDDIARSLPEDVRAKAKAYGLDLEDREQRREAADEVLAEWASRPEAPPRPITRAMVAIRGLLRKVFPSLKWSPDDVRALLARARARVEEGAEGTEGSGAPRFSRNASQEALVTVRRVVADARKASSWRDWYTRHKSVIDGLFDDDAPVFRRILAATSQAASVGANVGLAVKAYEQLRRGDPFTGFLPGVIKNLERIRADGAMEGPKITQYERASGHKSGAAQGAPVDRHVARYFFGVDSPSAGQIATAQRMMGEAADRLGWAPREIQAALWALKITQDAAARGVEAEVRSYADYLEAKADRIREFRRGFAADAQREGRGVPAGRGASAGDEGQREGVDGRDEVEALGAPRFARTAKETPKTLVALHNTTPEGIRAMGRLGGVPLPSIAVTQPGISFDKYGGVTLVGDRALVDPKRDPRNRVFESDIWSPRQPLPSRKFDAKAFHRFGDRVNKLLGNPKEWAQRFDPSAMDRPRDEGGFDRLIETFERSGYQSFHVQRAFLLSKGIDVPLQMREVQGRREINYGETRDALEAALEPHQEAFRNWLTEELEPVFGPEHLAAGRKRLPYTLDNLVDVMRKMGLRASEHSMFESLAKQKAKTARELRSVEAMHRAEGKLISESQMEETKEAMSLDFHAFADGLGQNRLFSGGFARLDEASASLGDAMKRGLSPASLKSALMARGFPEPSQETLDAGVEVARSLQQAPTQYFEGKPQRAVRLTEFRGAVIPEDSPADIRQILEGAGLEVRTYASRDTDARREAVEALSEERDLRFSRTPSSPGERRLMELLVEDARRRAAAAADAARRVQDELADPGDILEARKDESLPEHSREIQNHIRPVGRKGDDAPLLNPAEAAYQQLVRRHYALEKTSRRLGASSGEAQRDPGVVAELAAGHAARAEQFLVGNGGFRIDRSGNPEWTGNRSFAAILDTLGPGRLNELRRYLVARRAIELHHRSGPQKDLMGNGEETIYSGISEAAAQQEVAGAEDDVKAAAEQVTALLDDALRYWADAGGLSPKAVDVIRDLNRAYVPFYRIFEGKDPAKRSGRLVLPAQRGAALQAEQAVKTMFGSGRNILDPLVAVSDHIQRMIRAADMNRVGRTLVEAATLNPAAAEGLVEEVPQPGHDPGATREGQVVQDAAGNYGVDVNDEAASAISFLSDKKLTFANDRIRVWQDGKLREWRVEKSIGEALRALGPEDASLAKTILSFPARALRSGVTKNPVFALHNFLRDTGDAAVQSRNGFRPLIDSVIGLREAILNGDLRREWLAAGGGYATLSGGGIRGAEAALKEVAPKTRTQSVLRTFRHPLEALALLNRPFEEAARLGEYRLARQKGKNATEAALDSARVTTNFTVHGTDAFWWGLAKASAFVNPAIQGTDKAFRTVLEAPRGQKPTVRHATAAAANVVFKGLLNVGTLSALFYLLGDDDDEIKELRRTKQGATWWFVRVPGTEVVARFPKPFLWGQVFGTGVEAAIDRARGENPRAYKEWREQVLRMVSDGVMPIPTGVKAGFELTLNRSTFFQRPIVTRSLEGVEPRYQANPATSQLARKAGDVFNVSPAKIEYGVGAVGGTLGREALRAGDVFLRDGSVSRPAQRLGDMPLIGRAFARTPDISNDSTETFYDELEEVRRAVSTMKLLKKQDPAEAQRRRPEYHRALLAAREYERTADQLSDLRKLIERTSKTPDARLSPDEKRRKVDELAVRMTKLARRTVERRLLEEKGQ